MDDEETNDACQRYSYDFSSVTPEGALQLLRDGLPPNTSTTKCDRWEYDTSQYKTSIVTDASIQFHQLKQRNSLWDWLNPEAMLVNGRPLHFVPAPTVQRSVHFDASDCETSTCIACMHVSLVETHSPRCALIGFFGDPLSSVFSPLLFCFTKRFQECMKLLPILRGNAQQHDKNRRRPPFKLRYHQRGAFSHCKVFWLARTTQFIIEQELAGTCFFTNEHIFTHLFSLTFLQLRRADGQIRLRPPVCT